jgi:hypothetical protein
VSERREAWQSSLKPFKSLSINDFKGDCHTSLRSLAMTAFRFFRLSINYLLGNAPLLRASSINDLASLAL